VASARCVAEQCWPIKQFLYVHGAGRSPCFFDALTNDSAVTIYFTSPSNELVFALSGTSDSGPHVLPRSGTYTVDVVAGTSDAAFLFRLLDLNASSVPLTNGAVYGQDFSAISLFRADVYRYTGAVGQRVYFDSLEYEYDPVLSYLYGPNGQLAFGLGYADADAGPLTLAQPARTI